MDWMPSCESPARRMTASRIFCGRRSALLAAVVVEGADSERTGELLTVKNGQALSDAAFSCQ